ncbi:protein BASIC PENTACYSTEINE3-like isoform X1 [Mangifera indica]|uniref:protein BASIC PENTACYSTEINE3-like isoform X1 n=2 Tax=Mangifera indica TaxID=29780 RepID=UPI001CFC0430|nr:protein BASIC PENTACYSTEINE3-like isoform X1 [Mangifera indica]XP_044477058.1 protein BASIC PENTACYSTEINE3-like isoform X1 [Mangifera indica]
MEGDDSLDISSWGYYEPTTSFKSHMVGQFLPLGMPDKSLVPARNAGAVMASATGGFDERDMYSMEYLRDVWISQREWLVNVLPGNLDFGIVPEMSTDHCMQIDQVTKCRDEMVGQVEDAVCEKDSGTTRKKQSPKVPKSPKKAKQVPQVSKAENGSAAQRARLKRKPAEIVINGVDMDISSIPIPFCSCTGMPQQCYRWGCGGWQSACCTTALSLYPLPMSTKRRGARIAGRKMSLGAFKKVLEKLAAEGYDFSNPIDLKTNWAKHGTNKFVTIR